LPSEALVKIDTSTVEAEVAPVVRAADALAIVANVEQHERALTLLADVMGAETRIKKVFAPSIEAAKESKRKAELARAEIVALQDRILAPVLAARETISGKCKAFEAEERRVAALNQERLNAEAHARQDEERQFEAAMAETEEAAEEALTEPLPPPVVPIVKPEVAKVAGVSTRETWAAEITDKAAFLAWAARPENNFYAEPNMVALNSRARAEKGALRIPGVKAVPTLSHARK